MINITIEQVKNALPKINTGLKKYSELIKAFSAVDVAANKDFQRKFIGFFRMGRRSAEYYKMFFDFMQKQKSNLFDFETTLKFLYEKTNRIEASFCSKMVSIINPNMPVIDSFVMGHLKLKYPNSYKSAAVRINEWIMIYQKICECYTSFLVTDKAKEFIQLFDSQYSNTSITDVKKIDLILWQSRDIK